MIDEFYTKIENEFIKYKKETLNLDKENIFLMSYEICKKIEIYDMLSSEILPENIVKNLLLKENILDYIYNCWQKLDISVTENLRDLIFNLYYYSI